MDETDCKRRYEQGESLGDLVTALRAEGHGILESIKLLRTACGISLREAKRVVSNHPAWRDEVARNQPLHDAAEAAAAPNSAKEAKEKG
jgi:ribosomal protein L7/L12